MPARVHFLMPVRPSVRPINNNTVKCLWAPIINTRLFVCVSGHVQNDDSAPFLRVKRVMRRMRRQIDSIRTQSHRECPACPANCSAVLCTSVSREVHLLRYCWVVSVYLSFLYQRRHHILYSTYTFMHGVLVFMCCVRVLAYTYIYSWTN